MVGHALLWCLFYCHNESENARSETISVIAKQILLACVFWLTTWLASSQQANVPIGVITPSAQSRTSASRHHVSFHFFRIEPIVKFCFLMFSAHRLITNIAYNDGTITMSDVTVTKSFDSIRMAIYCVINPTAVNRQLCFVFQQPSVLIVQRLIVVTGICEHQNTSACSSTYQHTRNTVVFTCIMPTLFFSGFLTVRGPYTRQAYGYSVKSQATLGLPCKITPLANDYDTFTATSRFCRGNVRLIRQFEKKLCDSKII